MAWKELDPFKVVARMRMMTVKMIAVERTIN